MNRIVSTLIPFAAALCIAPFATRAPAAEVTAAVAVANAECAKAAAPLSSVQARVVEKAERGIVPLRDFVWRTRMIYQLDLLESVAWLDQRRELLRGCEQRSARVDPDDATSQ